MSEKAVGWSSSHSSSRKGFSASGVTQFLAKNVFHILLVVLQLGILYLLVNPINLVNGLDAVDVINKVSKSAAVPPTEVPVMARVGDGKGLKTADELRKGNAVDAQIYKDAKDGDYVLGYTSKLIVYRKDDNRIIYDGKTAQQLLADSQNTVVATVVKKAKDQKLVPADYNQTPAVSLVTDPEAVKKLNEFYKDVQKDDLIAQFSQPDTVVVYRPSTDQIIKSGSFALVIK